MATGQQVYVVTTQASIYGAHGRPVAAFSDYPDALTYAQSIFQGNFGFNDSPRDLIFLINMTAATTTTTSTTTTTPAATT